MTLRLRHWRSRTNKSKRTSDAELTLTINRSDLEQVMMGVKPLAAQIEDGTAKVKGDLGVLQQLGDAMVTFEMGFEILPGTSSAGQDDELNDFEVGPLELGE